MSLFSTLRYILAHPLNAGRPVRAIFGFVAWQLRCRMFAGPHRIQFVDQSCLMVKRGMAGATGNVYCGLHEFEDMGFVIHALRAGDLFVDVGANVGSYTVLASAVCKAQVISFEPVPLAQKLLAENIEANSVAQSVTVRPHAVSAQAATVNMISNEDATNRIVDSSDDGAVIEVQAVTLDSELAEQGVTAIKIDVEGHELAALAGAKSLLASQILIAAIIEVSNHTYPAVLRQFMQNGFCRARYHPFTRQLEKTDRAPEGNALFVRWDSDIHARLANAPKRVIHPVAKVI